MLANLMPPRTAVRLNAVDIVTATLPSRGIFVVHPRYRQWLHRHGLTRAEDVLALRGEIVSGHVDRHVRRIELGSRTLFLKREHRVGWRVRLRNWQAGFGLVSKCEREAMILKDLESQSLPCPQWIASGHCEGKAFLLVDDLAGAIELRNLLMTTDRNDGDLARRIADAVADVHAAGYDTPDLCAKHVFVRTDNGTVTLLDWPSSQKHETLSLESRVQAWAQLDASLAPHLASPRQRLRTLWHYWRRFRTQLPCFSQFVDLIQKASRRQAQRSSIREQHGDPSMGHKQRLVWLADDEGVCVVPALAECWPQPAMCRPFYPKRDEFIHDGTPLVLNAPDGQPATLRRWRTLSPIGRMIAFLKGRSWRSPAAKRARYLFHCQRHGHAAPQLLAFGQRFTSPVTTESFVLERS